MTDLKCSRCGIERSYADASIEDLNRSCDIDREPFIDGDGSVWGVTSPAKHDWIEA